MRKTESENMSTTRWQVFLKKVIHNNSQAESEATEDEDTSEEVELEKRLDQRRLQKFRQGGGVNIVWT